MIDHRTTSDFYGPDFICIGMQRAGTSWLYSELARHPNFWMPPVKDIHYFDRPYPDKRYERALRKAFRSIESGAYQSHPDAGIPERDFLVSMEAAFSAPYDLVKYSALFNSKKGRVSGDITPAYSTLSDHSVREIASAFPLMKVVMLIRDPIKRAWSHLSLNQRRVGGAPPSKLSIRELKSHLEGKAFRERSFQTEVYKRWLVHFGSSRLKYFFFDDIQNSPSDSLGNIVNFIIPASTEIDSLNVGSRTADEGDKIDKHPDHLEIMIQHFAHELCECSNLFGEGAVKWLENYKLQPSVRDGSHYTSNARDNFRIGIVSHNLQPGEGAPRSLLELTVGLNALPDLELRAYSAGDGSLASSYAAGDVDLEIFDKQYRHCVQPLNERFGEVRASFFAFLMRHNIDVVICNTVKSAPFAYFARELGIPSIVIVRESFTPAKRFSHFKGEARLAAELGLAEANEIVFVSEESRRAWQDYPFEGPISVINNGVSAERFADWLGRTRPAARSYLGIPNGRLVFVCVGTIGDRKGQRALVEAFAELPASVRDQSMLFLVGAGEIRKVDALNETLERLRPLLGDSVRYVGPTEDIGAWYRAADVFLMNSSNEAYPRSTMEAMLFGLPILSTRVFGVMTQVRDGHNGMLYDIGDMAAWAAHMQRLSTDEVLRSQLAANALQAFSGHTTEAEMISRYRALAEGLAARFLDAAGPHHKRFSDREPPDLA